MSKTVDFKKSIQSLNEQDLTARIKEDELRMKKLEFAHAISPLESPMNIRNLRREIARLKTELKNARLVNKDDFPLDVVRLNSMVRIKAEGKDKIMDLMLVTPDKADIKENRISVMAPIGTALIGFRKGQKVKWKVPAGERTFTIMEVINNQ